MRESEIFRTFMYSLILFLVFSVQSAYGFLPTIFGYKIDIIIPILISIVVIDNLGISIFIASITAFTYDFNFNIVQGFSFVFFVSIAIFVHFIVRHYYTRNIITQMLFSTITIFIYRLFIFAFMRTNFLLYFQYTSAEILISILFSPIAYKLVTLVKGKTS